MSRVVGGRWALEAGGAACGRRPVRTMGGWRRVEMAFWPDSTRPWDQFTETSSEPPTEWMELAVEPRR